MINYPKALEEVWHWKDSVSEKTSGMSMDETMEWMGKQAGKLLSSHGYEVKNQKLIKKDS